MHVTEERHSELFNMLSRLGLLSTEEQRIRSFREHDDLLYEVVDLSYEDIERVGYLYPHFALKLSYQDMTELWIDDTYINPSAVNWIETNNLLYGILDQHYDEFTQVVRCFYNPGIIYRYHNIMETPGSYAHTLTIDVTEPAYRELRNLPHSAYYITNNEIKIPSFEWIDDTHLKFTAAYERDIDFFLCGNLTAVVQAEKDVGIYLDRISSPYCYHRILIDHNASYPIDARFYPMIKVDKDCVVRVFTDSYHIILHPEVSRLMFYPEFVSVIDPYNTDNEYLRNLPYVTEMITSTDSDEEILEKFQLISSYCYRVWERYPYDYLNEQADFVVCDNSKFQDRSFHVQTVYLNDGEGTYLLSIPPAEPYRDLLFYQGNIYNDYLVRQIAVTEQGKYIESPVGTPTYLLPADITMEDLSLIKFNTFEDATFINIGEYINEDYVARLHLKLNRFYRNLLVIRNEFIDPQDKVRIATVQPDTKDSYLWYELLVNAVPEMFQNNVIDTISLYGLDPANIPEDVKEGAYMLELEPEDGPASYSQMLMTYFKLSKAKKKYLALQYGDGVDDPRIKVYHDISFGKESDPAELNKVILEHEEFTNTETEYEYGGAANPGTVGHDEGDLYVQVKRDVPPGEENIEIEKIVTGFNEPEEDEHTLWIDMGENPDLPKADEYDSIADSVTFVNDIEKLEPDKGDYAIDSTQDTFTPEQEGDVTIDDLLDGLAGGNPGDPDNDDIGDDLLDGLSRVVAENIQVEDVENPVIGAMALDDIQYVNSETWLPLTMEEVEAMSKEEKLASIHRLITDDNVPETAQAGDMWIAYLSQASEYVLNTVTYKILLTAYIYNINQPEFGALAMQYHLPDDVVEEAGVTYGKYIEWTKPENLIIHPYEYDEEGNVLPDFDQVKKANVTYIMNLDEPDNVKPGDLWLKIPAAYLGEIIKDVISQTLIEIGEELPEGYYFEDEHETYATMGFDYDAHDHRTEGVGELFQEVKTNDLTPVHYGGKLEDLTLDEGDLWYEFLDEIDQRVVYSDEYSMVIRMNERLYLLQFDTDNVQAFAFDDIVMNFKGRLGIRYMTLLADLINAGEITLDEINIFYKRLITFGDDLDPQLTRLYTGRSHVITKPKIDTSDYSIIYSTNLSRFRMDYSDPSTTRKEREAAYRMAVDYTERDFAFLKGKMIVFVNGKLIQNKDIEETAANLFEIKNFHEIIATVDIFYSSKDKMLMDLKKRAYRYWPIPDTSEFIQRPERDYTTMQYIAVHEFTQKGYYDVLLDEYIFNGRLQRILNYLEEHPEEAEDFVRDMKHKFHAISDVDLANINHYEGRIIIPGLTQSNAETPYQIGYQTTT